ncbi:MAG: gliding motility-associated C-terminal domain-containing protein [Bacteroidota bacterium]|nr:gliding motility-associated C-terminal domain-containing protein [Bacteroidota bacterium]
MKAIKSFFLLLAGLLISAAAFAQLQANAGADATICPGTSRILGGAPTASGGTAPYTYQWSPSTGLSNTTTASPTANPGVPTWYTVIVTDATGASDTDMVGVDLYSIYAFNGGNDTAICIGSTATLGDEDNSFSGGVTYFWSPNTALSSQTAPRPVTSTTITTTYSVTITHPNCPSKSYSVTVTVNPLPVIDACCYSTINEGESIILTATGGQSYIWTPSNNLSSSSSAATTADPLATTQYLVYGIDANQCYSWDTVTVNVIPSSELVFYNTFSPNGDGVNDFFYIGNAAKYPGCVLEVFTRTGQLVYSKTGYDNSWDGTNYGDKLPEATYYYVFQPGNGDATKFGHVTILR